MIYFYSLIFGLVQALTEFLPVSSSGHLFVLHKFLDFNFQDSLAFDVALHLGTVLALIIFFRKIIFKYLKSIVNFKDKESKVYQKSIFNIILATIPAVILGLIFDNYLETYLRQTWVVIVTLSTVAVLMLLTERLAKQECEFLKLNWVKSLIIGFAQVLALIPGVSRSGITIIAGMSMKLKRAAAAEFSFLLGIPIILGAGIYKMLGLSWGELSSMEVWVMVIGFMSSFIFGWIVIKYLLKFLKSHKLNCFAWYRILLALVLFIVFYLI